MSEPMTNREIEDVLTSIRRLVAQEGGRVENGRLILTEAQRVNALTQATDAAEKRAPGITAEPTATSTAGGDKAVDPDPEPGSASTDVSIPAPDFSKLEATIAELEAAVSARGDSFEGETAEGAPKASNVTELYGRLSFAHRAKDGVRDAANGNSGDDIAAQEPEAPQPPKADTPPAAAAADELARGDDPEPEQAPRDLTPEALDDEYPEDTILDEEALNALISQIVRDELRGQLGERITQQVRKLVRAEIARALEDRDLL